MKLRYQEALYSVQGEGKFVEYPVYSPVHLGCNSHCMNFGLGRDEPQQRTKT